MEVLPLLRSVLLGIGSGISMAFVQIQWGLVGEVIDYSEYITGERMQSEIHLTSLRPLRAH